MPDHIPEHGHPHDSSADAGGLLPTAKEREEREKAERERRAEGDHQLILDIQSRQATAQSLQAWLTGALVLVSIIGGFVAWLQFQASKKSADAAKSAADTASDALKQSKSDSIAQDKRTREALEASARQSKAALDASIEASRTDQRAWIGVATVTSPLFTDEQGRRVYLREGNVDQVVSVTFINSGKTPAIHYRSRIGMAVQRADHFSPTEHPTELGISNSVVAPGARIPAHAGRAMSGPLSRSILDQIRNRTLMLYFYGEILYEDIFKRPHMTHFCMQLDPSLTDFRDCPTYNDAD